MKYTPPFTTPMPDIERVRKILYNEGLDEACWMLDELVACRTEIMDLRLQAQTLKSKIGPPRVTRIDNNAPVQLELELRLPEKDPDATAQR